MHDGDEAHDEQEEREPPDAPEDDVGGASIVLLEAEERRISQHDRRAKQCGENEYRQEEGHAEERVWENSITQPAMDGLHRKGEEKDVAKNGYRLCEADLPGGTFVKRHGRRIPRISGVLRDVGNSRCPGVERKLVHRDFLLRVRVFEPRTSKPVCMLNERTCYVWRDLFLFRERIVATHEIIH